MVVPVQDFCATMSDLKIAVDLAETLTLPGVAPMGGSKWAASFCRDRVVVFRSAAAVGSENAVVHPDGRVAEATEGSIGRDETVAALPAGEMVGLGQFLIGPLNMLPPESAVPETWPPRFCGLPLTPRQTDVLARLGRLRGYVAIDSPQKFRRVLHLPASPGVLAVPVIRPLADLLRAPAVPRSGAIAILPTRGHEKFALANRASLTAWLRAKRVAILDPETMRLADLAASLAAASLVILADPRQAGLLGLCHPGAKLIEIAPEGWLGVEGRLLSQGFGLEWLPFLAAAPSYTLRGALPFGSLVPCSYEISIRDLAHALESHLTT
jgi:hypothetical protein